MQPIAPPQYQYPEDAYYGDGSVWVTSKRLISGTDFKLMRHISGARVQVTTGPERFKTDIINHCITLFIFGLWLFSIYNVGLTKSFFDVFVVGNGIFIACVLLLVTGKLVQKLSTRSKAPQESLYTLVVRYRFWNSKTVISPDQEYVERIAEAVLYALAQRSGAAHTRLALTNTASAESLQPVMQGGILYVGQRKYNLDEIRSAQLIATVDSSKETLGSGRLLLYGPFVWLTLTHTPGLIYAYMITLGLLLIGGIAFILSPTTSFGNTYTVELVPRSGSRTIVFASTSRVEAEQVRKSLADELAPQAALSTA